MDSATTQNSWRTSAQRTYLVCTPGRSLNFDRARWAGRWSTGMLRISLCGANAMYFWPVWVSPGYCKLQRNQYCDRRIFPVFPMLGVEPLLRAWLNYQASRVVIHTNLIPGPHMVWTQHTNIFRTPTSTSTTVNGSQKVVNLGVCGVGLNRGCKPI